MLHLLGDYIPQAPRLPTGDMLLDPNRVRSLTGPRLKNSWLRPMDSTRGTAIGPRAGAGPLYF